MIRPTSAILLALILSPAPAGAAENILVVADKPRITGGGLIKHQRAAQSISTVSSAYIRTQPAIQNVYQYLQLTPGALVATADPYGLSTQFSLTLRGLGQDELGYVLDGMPLNDIGYYTAYPSQFIDSENIDAVSLQQGAAELDSPVISAAGGLLTIASLDPALKPGGSVDASYGSYNTDRAFVRLDSGPIGSTNARAFLSYSHTGSDQWRGPGRVKRQHIDYKLVKEWGAGSSFSLTGTYHDGITPNYTRPTLAQFETAGANANYEPNFTPGDGAYWRLNTGTFRVLYMTAPTTLALTHSVTVSLTPYWQYGYGNAPYGATLSPDGNYQGAAGPYSIGIPNDGATAGSVMANYQDLQYRSGLTAKLRATIGHHTIVAGAWYDYADETDTQSFSGLSQTGIPGDIWADTDRGLIRLPNGQLLLAGQDHVITQTQAIFVADTLHLLDDRLTLEAGFKQAFIARRGTNGLPGPQYRAGIANAEPLPQLAISYQITPQQQIFANARTNFRTPSEATLFNAYARGQLTTAANTRLKPEYSIAEEIGYRYTGQWLTAAAVFFNYNFTNRQIATSVGGNLISESINAGGQTSQGLDLELGTQPWRHFSPYVSTEILHAVISNDLLVGTDTLPTAGKTAVRSPDLQTAFGLRYDDDTVFGTLAVKHVSSQYATFMNDEKIPGTTTLDVGVGYRPAAIALPARPELKLNVINLTGADYLSGVANPTANAKPTLGRGGTMIAGSPPNYFLSGGLTIIVTATQAF